MDIKTLQARYNKLKEMLDILYKFEFLSKRPFESLVRQIMNENPDGVKQEINNFFGKHKSWKGSFSDDLTIRNYFRYKRQGRKLRLLVKD